MVPAIGSNLACETDPVSCGGAETRVFEGSTSDDSPVRFSRALADDMAVPNSCANSSAEGVRYFGSFSRA